MKNHRELTGVIANILIVIVILLVIVVGLNKIGVYSLPEWAQKIVGTYEQKEKVGSADDRQIYSSLSFDEKKGTLIAGEISYENAKGLLLNVEPVKNYEQEIIIEHVSEDATRTERISAVATNGLYRVDVYDKYSNLKTVLSQTQDNVTVTNYHSTGPLSNVFPKGDFDIYEQCGFILTAENFLNSGFALDAASFNSEFSEEYGYILTVAFKNTLENYTQTEQYTISLDYGVVVSAFCFEDDTLVYSMTTSSLKFGD